MFQKISCSILFCLTFPIAAIAIERPQTTTGVEVAPSSVKWSWAKVEDAVSYEVSVDGIKVTNTPDTSYTSTDLFKGQHSMHVRAVAADSSTSYISPTAIVIVGDDSADQTTTNKREFSASADPTLIDPASASEPGAISKPGYELVFSDEFNGTSLNEYRWNTHFPWDGEFNGERYEYRVINGEDQFYVSMLSEDPAHIDFVSKAHNPFEFNGERLAIRGVKNTLKNNTNGRRFGPLRDIATQQTFLSGVITTYDKFAQKYGYFEAKIKIPGQDGTFPAFWLHHQRRANEDTRRSEIDIMENLGHAPQYIYNSFHWFKNVSATNYGDHIFEKPLPSGQVYTGVDYSLDYHVYAVEWDPNKITWFIDGEKVSELNSENVNHEELYVILNLAFGGNWTNFGENAGGLGRASGQEYPNGSDLAKFQNPALEIDYVRAYKRR